MVKERDHRIIEKQLSSLLKNFHFITLVTFLIVDYYYIPCSRVYMHAQLLIRLTFLELSLTSFFFTKYDSRKKWNDYQEGLELSIEEIYALEFP